MLMMRAPSGGLRGDAKNHEKKTVHRRHAGVGGTGVRPNSASQKAEGQQGYSRDDPG